MLLILLIFAPRCFSFDIELEGVLRMGDDFLENLNKDVKQYHSLQKEMDHLAKSDSEDIRIKFPKDIDYRKSASNLEESTLPVIDEDKIYAIALYLEQNGHERLKAFDKLLNDKLGIKKNLNSFSEKAAKHLRTEIFDYVKLILQTNLTTATVIDREFVVIDLIDTANKLLLNALQNSVEKIISSYKIRYIENMKIVSQKMHVDVLSEKKDNLWYVCSKFSVCRPYPAFSDFFADMITVIINTNKTDFNHLIQFVEKVLQAKYVFFEKLIHVSVYRDIVNKLNIVVREYVRAKNLLLHVRSVIINRHKMHITEEEDYNIEEGILKPKTKATKILIDILDKAFDIDGSEIVELNFNVVTNGLNAWKMKEKLEIDRLVVLFVNYVVDTLKNSLTPYTVEEIKTLTEVIWKGNATNQDLLNNLFTNGSKFVTGINARDGIY